MGKIRGIVMLSWIFVAACGGSTSSAEEPAPATGECTEEECGPQPMSNQLCPDGVTESYADACTRRDDGSCGWHIIPCPEDAPASTSEPAE